MMRFWGDSFRSLHSCLLLEPLSLARSFDEIIAAILVGWLERCWAQVGVNCRQTRTGEATHVMTDLGLEASTSTTTFNSLLPFETITISPDCACADVTIAADSTWLVPLLLQPDRRAETFR